MIERVSLADFGPKFKAYVAGRYTDVVKATQLSMQTSGKMIIERTVDETTPHKPVDRGGYKRNWTARDIPAGSVLYNPTKYAGVIEHGRRASPVGKKGIEALMGWVHRHGMATATKGAGSVKSIAFAIANHMKNNDTPGKFVLQRARPAIIAELQADIVKFLSAGKF